MTKRLLITSDDFGMCHAVNEGIARAMTEGVVRSTNFLVPCPWFPEALELARRHRLPCGIHLCLTCDWDHLKWRPLTHAPSLCDASGHFLASYAELEQRARDEEMLAELSAQVEAVLRLGFTPTHADSHMFGTFSTGPFAERVRHVHEEVCRRHGLGYTYAVTDSKPRHFKTELVQSGLSVPELWRELESLGDGTHHLIGHAAVPSPELEAMCSPGHHARVWAAAYRTSDFAWYTHPDTARRLAALGFELIGVKDALAIS
ncbi:MAG TPA: ChbG/HpnK family deacetylase [Polyangiaceae bacterium]|nr:ChbG/HpnK family deacetylase [Polyangiaceae bacterium]